MTPGIRGNQLGPLGWLDVMDVLEWSSALTSLNDYELYRDLVCGGQTWVDLHGKEVAVAMSRFFRSNGDTLTTLDLRCVQEDQEGWRGDCRRHPSNWWRHPSAAEQHSGPDPRFCISW